jgi:para-aminobenzoate synthetase component I
MRQVHIPDWGPQFKRKILHWAASKPYAVFLDSCDTDIDRYGRYEFIVGVGSAESLQFKDLEGLEATISADPFSWRFGALGYGLKNSIEPKLKSLDDQFEAISPEMHFFQAEIVISKPRDSKMLVFESGFSDSILAEIEATEIPPAEAIGFAGFKSNFSPDEYKSTVELLRQHIYEGDAYEINLSQSLSAQCKLPHPAAVWEKLIELSPTPFAGYAKWLDQHLLCASPERFLQLKRGKLLTQPIKGTAPRGHNPETDANFAETLRNSIKEQAENVMIVDLSRNDLHRSCEVGSVEVPHLFEVQRFPQVFHLVSTIAGQKRLDVHPIQAIRNAFPPGSMTGAPKVRACELISTYERNARGYYAGALGYFAPGGDFDLNVVIRSLYYDAKTEKLSYQVGGAITWDSNPAEEYAETLLKAKAIEGVFGGM